MSDSVADVRRQLRAADDADARNLIPNRTWMKDELSTRVVALERDGDVAAVLRIHDDPRFKFAHRALTVELRWNHWDVMPGARAVEIIGSAIAEMDLEADERAACDRLAHAPGALVDLILGRDE